MPRDDDGGQGPRLAPLNPAGPSENPLASLVSIEAEQALLGALLIRNGAFEQVVEIVRPQDFANPVHGRIYAAIGTLIERGASADPISLKNLFDQDGALTDIGGARYLAQLVSSAVSIVNAPHYARQIADLAHRRSIIVAFQDAIADASVIDLDRPASVVLEEFDRRLIELGEAPEQNQPMSIAAAVDVAIEAAEQVYKADGRVVGVTTGLVDLDRRLGGLHPSNLIIIAGRPAMGKAQPLDSAVLLRNGMWRALGNLRLGDALASVDGAPSFVAGVFPQGRRPVYRVSFSDGRSARCCGEHLWRVRSSRWRDERVIATDRLRDLLRQDRYRRRISIPVPDGSFGTDGVLPIEPWLMGVILAVGCFSEGKSNLNISTADGAILYRVQSLVGQRRVRAVGNDYDYRVIADGCAPKDDLAAILDHLGLAGIRSKEKFIPPQYLSAGRQARLDLLRGLLDTHGWVESFGAVRICVSSERLAKDIVALVRSLGGVCSISGKAPRFIYKGESRAGLPAFVCNIRHPSRSSLFTLRRKQRRCNDAARFCPPTFVSIEPDGEAEVACIAVTHPSSLYVTDEYVMTHNTALATSIAVAAARAGHQVLVFELEMAARELAARLLAGTTGISSEQQLAGPLSTAEMTSLIGARDGFAGMPLTIDDTPAAAVSQLRSRSRRHKRRHGLDLIVVDYLQLLLSDKVKAENRVQEVSAITRGLKMLAKEMRVPVIALSQLSREVEKRDDKRPLLADLRESGSIEQDADVVIFLYREEEYHLREQPKRRARQTNESFADDQRAWQDKLDEIRNIAELLIRKNRHGQNHNIRIRFDPERTSFTDLFRGEVR